MSERVRPYLFYDVALTICSQCFRKLEGKMVFQDDKVYLLKRCPEHGDERVLIADDVDYYRRCREVFLAVGRGRERAAAKCSSRSPKCPWFTTRR